MKNKQSSDFVWGIIGNILASLLIAIANIFAGRFMPNAPREVLDVASLLLPLSFIFIFLYQDRIKKIRIEPRLWLLQIRKLLIQAPQTKQIGQFAHRFINGVRQSILRLFEIGHQTKNLANHFEKAIEPSVVIVTLITVFLIVGFGVSVRWLFEQRTITTISPVYDSYRQIYDFLAP